jgi:chaperonin cofactor prefoldin
MKKTVNELDKAINTLIMDNRKLAEQLAKLKQMILINTFVDWNSSDMSAREEFQELYNLIEEVV